MLPANLTYHITEGLLTGKVAGQRVHWPAQTGVAAPPLSDEPEGAMGAAARAIPVGIYRLGKPVFWQGGLVVNLQPVAAYPGAKVPTGNFRIHGNRLLGSDQAIQLLHAHEFARLIESLKQTPGGRVEVRARMEGNYPERWEGDQQLAGADDIATP